MDCFLHWTDDAGAKKEDVKMHNYGTRYAISIGSEEILKDTLGEKQYKDDSASYFKYSSALLNLHKMDTANVKVNNNTLQIINNYVNAISIDSVLYGNLTRLMASSKYSFADNYVSKLSALKSLKDALLKMPSMSVLSKLSALKSLKDALLKMPSMSVLSNPRQAWNTSRHDLTNPNSSFDLKMPYMWGGGAINSKYNKVINKLTQQYNIIDYIILNYPVNFNIDKLENGYELRKKSFKTIYANERKATPTFFNIHIKKNIVNKNIVNIDFNKYGSIVKRNGYSPLKTTSIAAAASDGDMSVGIIPADLSHLSSLERLDLSSNILSGNQ
jgi:hypothetical protein